MSSRPAAAGVAVRQNRVAADDLQSFYARAERDAGERLFRQRAAHGRSRGGRSRGGRFSKIHAIADAKGRLLSIQLSSGEAHFCPPAGPLIRRSKLARKLLAGKAWDRAALRQWRQQACHSQQAGPQAALQLRPRVLQTAAS